MTNEANNEVKTVQVRVADLCKQHVALLVQQLRMQRNDPWRAAVVVAQVTLFQGVTSDPRTYERLGGNIERLSEFGCLACHRPDLFGEVVDAGQRGGLSAMKALGDRWVAEATARSPDDHPATSVEIDEALCDALTAAKAWDDFQREAVDPSASQAERQYVAMVFFAGVAAAIKAIDLASVSANERTRANVTDALRAEVVAQFAAWHAARE